MKELWFLVLQFFLLLLFIHKDGNNGGRELFQGQHWKPSHVLLLILSANVTTVIAYYLLEYHVGKCSGKAVRCVTHMSFLFTLLILFKYQIKQSIRAVGFKINKKHIIATIAIVLGWHVVTCAILYLAKGPHGFNFKTTNEAIRSKAGWQYPLQLFYVVVFAPIIEEVTFRGFLYSPYRKKYGWKAGIVLSSLLFCTYHSLTAFSSALTRGILHGVLYEKMESIVPCIIAHSANNLLVIVTLLLVNLLFAG